jgi:dTDP-4-dehydrorhamnose 3,5-epimerase
MNVETTVIDGVLILQPKVFGDARGFFFESFNQGVFDAAVGRHVGFVQDNHSRSARGVLRGLHLQNPFAQGKLVSVPVGEVFDVALDVRVGSPTFGRWFGATLSGENQHQLYVPPGFAHGFCALRDGTLFSYKCTELYHPETELGVRWDDPELAITWPVEAPAVSGKDARFARLRDIDPAKLPVFTPG